ncbi:MAG: (d)CMP kinase [Candidatus Dormibacteraeota bacterium]|nr:(d)CMP kinase [Candidatus Dormibacteraeota bacterium]
MRRPGEAQPLIIAIDGPAGAGKSSVSRRLAERLGVPFIDSGMFYRAVTLLADEEQLESADADGLVAIASRPGLRIVRERILMNDRDLTDLIHRPEINERLSAVAQVPQLRDAINARQRQLAASGAVVAGRDIGTVVFPETAHKFFLTAGLAERVRRRLAQITRRGEIADADAMEREVAARDLADSTRAVAPLRPAPDAVVIETDGLALEEVVGRILNLVKAGPAR